MTTAARTLDPLGQWPKFDTWFAAHRLREFDRAWATIEAKAQVWDQFFQGLHLYLASGSYRDAINVLRAGMQVDPQDPEFPACVTLISLDLGQLEQAREFAAKALEADPQHKVAALAAALYELDAGRIERARTIAAGAVENSRSFRFQSVYLLPRILRDRSLDEASPEQGIDLYYELFPQLHDANLDGTYPVVMPTGMVHVALDLSMLLDRVGRNGEAQSLRRAAALMLDTLPPDGLFGYAVARAELLALQDDRDGALRELEQALARDWGQLWKFHTRYNRNFDRLKDDPRYEAVLDELEQRMTGHGPT